MATVKNECYDVCTDCMNAISTGDFSFLNYHYNEPMANKREGEILSGMESIEGGAVFQEQIDEFSGLRCDCCRTKDAGKRFRFHILDH